MADPKSKITPGQMLYFILSFILFPALILGLAGNWSWIEGWVFSIWFLVMTLSIGVYLQIYDPALLAERQKVRADNQKGWDRYYLWVTYSLLLVWILIMPLDKRFGWTTFHFSLWLKIFGGIALLPALYLLFRSVADNTFASTLVRIQSERKQQVVSTGAYGWVRHPMYLGDMLMLIGAPVMTGSGYGLLIGLISVLLMIGRIFGEEKMLIDELEGYRDYMKKVRFRLIPFLW